MSYVNILNYRQEVIWLIYDSPFQIMNEAIINYPQHVCGH